MKRINSITRCEALRIALLASIIIGAIKWLRTGTINGLCFLWTAPLIMLVDDGLLEDWAQKKLEEMQEDE